MKTILLIHGLWVTPTSWESFQRFYEARGYKVIASAWPGIKGDVASMRRDPSSLNGIGIAEVMAHYIGIIKSLVWRPDITLVALVFWLSLLSRLAESFSESSSAFLEKQFKFGKWQIADTQLSKQLKVG